MTEGGVPPIIVFFTLCQLCPSSSWEDLYLWWQARRSIRILTPNFLSQGKLVTFCISMIYGQDLDHPKDTSSEASLLFFLHVMQMLKIIWTNFLYPPKNSHAPSSELAGQKLLTFVGHKKVSILVNLDTYQDTSWKIIFAILTTLAFFLAKSKVHSKDIFRTNRAITSKVSLFMSKSSNKRCYKDSQWFIWMDKLLKFKVGKKLEF